MASPNATAHLPGYPQISTRVGWDLKPWIDPDSQWTSPARRRPGADILPDCWSTGTTVTIKRGLIARAGCGGLLRPVSRRRHRWSRRLSMPGGSWPSAGIVTVAYRWWSARPAPCSSRHASHRLAEGLGRHLLTATRDLSSHLAAWYHRMLLATRAPEPVSRDYRRLSINSTLQQEDAMGAGQKKKKTHTRFATRSPESGAAPARGQIDHGQLLTGSHRGAEDNRGQFSAQRKLTLLQAPAIATVKPRLRSGATRSTKPAAANRHNGKTGE